MGTPVIVSGARTAVGSFGGSLKDVPAVDLGALVVKEAMRRAGLRPALDDLSRKSRPAALGKFDRTELQGKHYDYAEALAPVHVDECILGNVIQAGQGQNPGRQASIRAGLPEETVAFTVNKVCASGMKAIAVAAQAIRAGESEVVVAGGMENMSAAPYSLPRARWGYRMDMFEGSIVDIMVHDGLWEIFNGYHMGVTAENIAAKYKISREEQDLLGVMSHDRALAAIAEGRFRDEIVPVVIPQRKGDPIVFDTDERPMKTDLPKMAKLKPAFRKDGTVTAGNASGINDGAAAVVIMDEAKAKALGLAPLARIVGAASGGVDPAYMGLGPVPAVRKLLARTGRKLGDMEVVELNEAFAVQALACLQELQLDKEAVNLNGSGISLGHPIGATGARLVYSLAMQMKARGAHQGLAALCIGGGQGMAMILEA